MLRGAEDATNVYPLRRGPAGQRARQSASSRLCSTQRTRHATGWALRYVEGFAPMRLIWANIGCFLPIIVGNDARHVGAIKQRRPVEPGRAAAASRQYAGHVRRRLPQITETQLRSTHMVVMSSSLMPNAPYRIYYESRHDNTTSCQ